jgi:hypothetical protein
LQDGNFMLMAHDLFISFTLQLCDLLAKEYDTIRREYWNYVARCLAQRMNCSQEGAPGSSQSG